MAGRPLQAMFETVPASYDLVNAVVTLGMDRVWRGLAARECLAGFPAVVLDLCTGTGDLAIEIARTAPVDTRILALDFTAGMLRRAHEKTRAAEGRGRGRRIELVRGDAGRLPIASASVGAIGIAFALRNLTFRNPGTASYLAEALRILEPGGRLVAVETSQPEPGPLRAGYHAWMGVVAGPAGGLLSGRPHAYRYLAYSARNYMEPSGVEALLRGAGFATVRSFPLMGGVAAVHVAIA